MPTVTVVIPNYNHARFLAKRIESVLNQTYQDFEVLYLDDASTDHSAEVFAPYAAHERIRSITNAENSGSAFKQWNKGVCEATGKYIWIAESDDYADKRLLERLVDALDAHPNAGLAQCQSIVVDAQDELQGTMEWWTSDLHPTRWQHDFLSTGTNECQDYLAQKNTIPNASAVVFRRDIYLQAGGADETLRVCGDWLCWIKCLLLSDLVYVSEPLNFFRTHNSSVRFETATSGLQLEEIYRVLAFIKQHSIANPAVQRRTLLYTRTQWMNTLLQMPCPISWGRNWQIYLRASRVDPYIHCTLLRTVAKILRIRAGALVRRFLWKSRR